MESNCIMADESRIMTSVVQPEIVSINGSTFVVGSAMNYPLLSQNDQNMMTGGQQIYVTENSCADNSMLTLPFQILQLRSDQDGGLEQIPSGIVFDGNTEAMQRTIVLDSSQMAVQEGGQSRKRKLLPKPIKIEDSMSSSQNDGTVSRLMPVRETTADAIISALEGQKLFLLKDEGNVAKYTSLSLINGELVLTPEEDRDDVQLSIEELPPTQHSILKHKEPLTERPIGKGPFTCDHCGQEIAKWLAYKRHLKEHLSDKPFCCLECPASFNVERNLLLHQALHDESSLTCNQCNRSFRRFASLRAHLTVHEEDEMVRCDACDEEFVSMKQLEVHMEEHEVELADVDGSRKASAEVSYMCRKCLWEFSSHAELLEHMAIHRKVKKLTSCPTRRKRSQLHMHGNHHQCEECGKGFLRQCQLVRHFRIHTGERPFKCLYPGCNRAFNQKGTLLIHSNIHTGTKSYSCEFCGKKFIQKSNLRCHVRRVHPVVKSGELFQCPECSCVFKKAGTLNAHISRAHSIDDNNLNVDMAEDVRDVVAQLQQLEKDTKDSNLILEKSRHCVPADGSSMLHTSVGSVEAEGGTTEGDLLQQALTNSGLEQTQDKSELVRRRKLARFITVVDHTGTRPGTGQKGVMYRKHTVMVRWVGELKYHLCNFNGCTKEFKKPSDLLRHMRIHTQERPFGCEMCMRTFTVKSTLLAHMRTHSCEREYRYSCDQCDKKFTTASSLKIHSWVHTGQKPFPCAICGKMFRTFSQHKAHLLTHTHSPHRQAQKQRLGPVPDIPMQEPILITSSGPVKMVARHSQIYVCDLDGLVTKENGVQVTSLRPHRCRYCPAAFKKSSHMKQHERMHTGERPFICEQCYREFSSRSVLKMHYRTHGNERNFVCPLCNDHFVSKGSLKRHLTTHSSVRPYMCPYCQKTFKTNPSCKKHMKTHKHELAVQAVRGNVKIYSDEVAVPLQSELAQYVLVQDGIVVEPGNEDMDHVRVISRDEFEASSLGAALMMPGMGGLTSGEGGERISGSLDDPTPQVLNEDAHFASHMTSVIHGPSRNIEDRDFSIEMFPMASLRSTQNISPTLLTENVELGIPSSLLIGSNRNDTNDEFPIIDQTFTIDDTLVGGDNHDPPEGGLESDGDEFISGNVGHQSSPILSSAFAFQRHADVKIRVAPITVPKCKPEMRDFEKSDLPQSSDVCQLLTDTRLSVSHSSVAPELAVVRGKPFSCRYCDRTCNRLQSLQRHELSCERANSGVPEMKCIDCGIAFSSQEDFRSHNCTGAKFTCPLCSLTFSSGLQLRKHKLAHSKPRKPPSGQVTSRAYQCPICSEVHTSTVGFQRHLSSHRLRDGTFDRLSEEGIAATLESDSQPRILTVGQMNAILKVDSGQSATVVRKRKGTEEFYETDAHNDCNICGKNFKKPSDLIRHIRIHTGEKPYACEQCNKTFAVKSTLDVHMRTHTGKKDYMCHVCNTFFSTRGSRNIHMRLHTGSKPFQCPYCQLTFRTSGHKKSHVIKHFKTATTVAMVGKEEEIDFPVKGNFPADGTAEGESEEGRINAVVINPDGSVSLQLQNLTLGLAETQALLSGQAVSIDETLLSQLQQSGVALMVGGDEGEGEAVNPNAVLPSQDHGNVSDMRYKRGNESSLERGAGGKWGKHLQSTRGRLGKNNSAEKDIISKANRRGVGKLPPSIPSEKLGSKSRKQSGRMTRTWLPCDVPNCGQEFPDRSSLESHKVSQHRQECLECRLTFALPSQLEEHMRVAHTVATGGVQVAEEEVVTCIFCPAAYRSFLEVHHHIIENHLQEAITDPAAIEKIGLRINIEVMAESNDPEGGNPEGGNLEDDLDPMMGELFPSMDT